MKLPQLPHDKANHFVYGSIVYLLASVLFTPITSLVIVVSVAISKELYDKVSKTGNPEILDAVATIAGALPLYIVNILE